MQRNREPKGRFLLQGLRPGAVPALGKEHRGLWRAPVGAMLLAGALLVFGARDAHGRALDAQAAGSAQDKAQAASQTPDPHQLFDEARKAQESGDNALAVQKYEQLLRLHPDVVAAHANLAVALVSLGRYEEAITQYHIALAEAPGSVPLRMDLGLAYYKKGDFAGAAATFASLRTDQPDSVRIATLLANSDLQLGLVDQSLALLDPLEKANADNLDLEWALGTALIHAGKTREGLERVQKVAERGHNADAYQLAADLYLGLAYFDKARDDAQAVIRLNPNMSKAYVVLGMVDDYAGNEKAAVAEYKKALQVNPKDLQARLRLVIALFTDRKLDEARQQVERVLAASPNAVGALYELALIDRAQGKLPEALKHLQMVEQQDPNWLDPHVELVALYYRMNRPADGAREKKIVDRLRAEQRRRRDRNRIIAPTIPSH